MSQRTTRTAKRVRFQLNADPNAEVFVAGTFNNWNPAETRPLSLALHADVRPNHFHFG